MDIKKLKEFLATKEGQQSIDEFFGGLKRKDKIITNQLERFHIKYGDKDKFISLIEKVIEKYDSDAYKERCYYKLGIEPPEDLYWFLAHYAEQYGRGCTKEEWDKYGNMFTSELWFVNDYYFNRMDGQGSAMKVIKKND